MPRFGLKTILIVFTVVALWLSTFTGYAAASDVRRSLVILTLAASIMAAFWNSGRRQAFWLGFAIVVVPMGFSIYYSSQQLPMPLFYWTTSNSYYFTAPTPQVIATQESIRAVGALLLATIAGFIGVFVYNQTRESDA